MYLHYFISNNMSGGAYRPMSIHAPNKEEALGFFHKHEMKIAGIGLVFCCLYFALAATFKSMETKESDPKKKDSQNAAFWIFFISAIICMMSFCFATGIIMHS
jgi:hypothetical protein